MNTNKFDGGNKLSACQYIYMRQAEQKCMHGMQQGGQVCRHGVQQAGQVCMQGVQ
jgi:hypothetical protein